MQTSGEAPGKASEKRIVCLKIIASMIQPQLNRQLILNV